jgi:hypothetical protein
VDTTIRDTKVIETDTDKEGRIEGLPGMKLWLVVMNAYAVADSRAEAWKKARSFIAQHEELDIERVSLMDPAPLKAEDFSSI